MTNASFSIDNDEAEAVFLKNKKKKKELTRNKHS